MALWKLHTTRQKTQNCSWASSTSFSPSKSTAMKRKIKLDNTCWHVWLRERNGKELITSWDLGRHSRYYTWHWLWGVAQIFYLKRILLRHLRGNLRTDISNVFSFSETQWTEYSWLANPFLFSDRTSRLTTLITLSESQNEFIQRNCLLRNQNYLYAFRLKYLVWRKTICRKKKGEIAHTFVWFALSAITARSKSTFESFYPSSCRLNYPKMAG